MIVLNVDVNVYGVNFFLSVFLPYLSDDNPSALSAAIKTDVTPSGEWIAQLRGIKIRIEKDGQWSVVRAK